MKRALKITPLNKSYFNNTAGTFLAFAIVALLFLPTMSQAQSEADTVTSLSGIVIETSVDKADIYVGDLINYQIKITYDSTYELIPPPLGANLGAFDVRNYNPDNLSRLDDGRKQNISSFTLSTFTTGEYLIPPVAVMFILPDKSRKVMMSETVPIKVNSLLLDTDDSADIYEIKEPYAFPQDNTPYYFWGGIALFGILLFSWLFWWMRSRRSKEEEIDLRPPWEIAFERLAMLEQRNLVREGLHKQFYYELTEIVREYLGRMYMVNVLDMTTEEFLSHIGDRETPTNLHEDLNSFLRHADLVKFAKLIPGDERALTDFKIAHEMTELVRADFQKREEARRRENELAEKTKSTKS